MTAGKCEERERDEVDEESEEGDEMNEEREEMDEKQTEERAEVSGTHASMGQKMQRQKGRETSLASAAHLLTDHTLHIIYMSPT